nr:hypothetical protein [Nocardia sp. NRRL WC-3656]
MPAPAEPDTLVRTPTPPSAPDRAHRPDRAHAFFWCVLVASATVSVTGNAVHAVLPAPAPPIAGAVAVVPPIALLTAVHGVAIDRQLAQHLENVFVDRDLARLGDRQFRADRFDVNHGAVEHDEAVDRRRLIGSPRRDDAECDAR